MTESKTFTEKEAHRLFAVQYHERTWKLLDNDARSLEDTERMIHYAQTSLAHWLEIGTPLNEQRGEWLLSRVYAVVGLADFAFHHAMRCMKLTLEHSNLMQDYDLAFAYESMARAHALKGDQEETRKYIQLADEAGKKIKDAGDRDYFFSDFVSGNWNGMK